MYNSYCSANWWIRKHRSAYKQCFHNTYYYSIAGIVALYHWLYKSVLLWQLTLCPSSILCSNFRPDIHSTCPTWEFSLLFSSSNLFPACIAAALLSDALSVTMYGESARVTWSPVTFKGERASLSLSFLLSLWCTFDCCRGNGNLLTRGVSGDGVKIICTCSWGAVCQVNTCHQAVDGLRPRQTSAEISLKLFLEDFSFAVFLNDALEICHDSRQEPPLKNVPRVMI